MGLKNSACDRPKVFVVVHQRVPTGPSFQFLLRLPVLHTNGILNEQEPTQRDLPVKDLRIPVYLSEENLKFLASVDNLPEDLREDFAQACEAVAGRRKGAEALRKLSPALLEALSLQVSETVLPLAALQGKHWAREIALWLEENPRLLLAGPESGLENKRAYTLYALPPAQDPNLSPLSDDFEGVALSSHESRQAAQQQAARYALPVVEAPSLARAA